MKTITVQQPWAWAIIHGGKNIENRTRIGTWAPAAGSRIAIHAGKRWSDRGGRSPLILRHPDYPDCPVFYGAVIGTAQVSDVHHEAFGCCQPWGEQSYTEHGGTKRIDVVHLILEHPRPVDPIDVAGALGLWTLPADIAEALT